MCSRESDIIAAENDRRKQARAQKNAAEPSLSDAIKEVERLYDEWWDIDRRRWLNVVLERLKSLRDREALTPKGEQS